MPRDNFENLDEEIMRVIFDLFDSDGGGTIGREEVPEMIRTLLFEVPREEQVDQLLQGVRQLVGALDELHLLVRQHAVEGRFTAAFHACVQRA